MKNKARYYTMVQNHKGEWRKHYIIHTGMVSAPDETYTTRSELIKNQIHSDYYGK